MELGLGLLVYWSTSNAEDWIIARDKTGKQADC